MKISLEDQVKLESNIKHLGLWDLYKHKLVKIYKLMRQDEISASEYLERHAQITYELGHVIK